ncbi:MAG: hypothetical protein OJF49_000768 [Ktedonobacterales bacterium]|nr:MAG: hypothetical protein OJF49_000768 [Ktedonobacterales bacterium]
MREECKEDSDGRYRRKWFQAGHSDTETRPQRSDTCGKYHMPALRVFAGCHCDRTPSLVKRIPRRATLAGQHVARPPTSAAHAGTMPARAHTERLRTVGQIVVPVFCSCSRECSMRSQRGPIASHQTNECYPVYRCGWQPEANAASSLISSVSFRSQIQVLQTAPPWRILKGTWRRRG